MKKKIIFSMLVLASFFRVAVSAVPNINELNWINVSQKHPMPEITIDFAQPLYFERRINKDQCTVEFAFPGMTLRSFKKDEVCAELRKLKEFVQDVKVEYRKKPKAPSERVVLLISFFKEKDIIIRWVKRDDPNRLLLHIFSKQDLERQKQEKQKLDRIKNQENILFYVHNTVKKKTRILVDAGHGGNDPGAHKGHFGLKEKDIALDIALKVKNLLQKKGFERVYLTRSADETLSLFERCELAGQLKADVGISIHVNAVSKFPEKAHGVETYYLRGKRFLSPGRNGGFLFVCNEKDKMLAKKADTLLKKNVIMSKKLAGSIQSGIIKAATAKKINIGNKGVRKEEFRVLLSCQMPVALIEVGFLTNKKEAKRLANANYRMLLAQGIASGIMKYVSLI